MSVQMTQHIRPMRGGSQSHLMLGEDDNLYVVKYQNNPQGRRVLVNEMFGNAIARKLSLSVPTTVVADVPLYLITSTKDLRVHLEHGDVPMADGLQFGSKYVGGFLAGLVTDLVPPSLRQIINIAEFAGSFVFDCWTMNVDFRGAVFSCTPSRRNKYQAHFIDQGYCFNTQKWDLSKETAILPYRVASVYNSVRSIDNFEPWLTMAERFEPQDLLRLSKEVPEEWLDGTGEKSAFHRLIDALAARRKEIRPAILKLHLSPHNPFGHWARVETSFPSASSRSVKPNEQYRKSVARGLDLPLNIERHAPPIHY